MLEFINSMPEGATRHAENGAVIAADCERTLLPLVARKPASDEDAGLLRLLAETWTASGPGGRGLVYTSRSALR